MLFPHEKDYAAHLKRGHPSTFDRAESEQARTLAREPLTEIPAADCPCCTDWVDRLKEHASLAGGLRPNEVLTVDPTAFKRHLAKHLEQLAVFAIPTSATADDSKNSTDANEADNTYMDSGESYDQEVYAPTTQSTQAVLPAMKNSQVEPSSESIAQATPLSAEAREQSTSYNMSTNNWIWSEPHQDHYYVTVDQYSKCYNL